jgi:hypothetical protein
VKSLNEREKKLRREISKWLATIAKNVELNLTLRKYVLKMEGSPIVEVDLSAANEVIEMIYSMDAEVKLEDG